MLNCGADPNLHSTLYYNLLYFALENYKNRYDIRDSKWHILHKK